MLARRSPVSGPTLTVVAGLVAATVLLVSQARRLYFFGDDWLFLLHRSLSFPQLLEPHNEHWSTLPVIAFRVMFRLVGLDYLPYALMVVALHLVCTTLLYSLMRRSEIPAWPAALVSVSFALMAGATAENPLWDFQIGFTGSAVFALLALHALVRPGLRWTSLAAVVLVVSLMSSGMSVFLTIWVGLVVLLHDGWRRALAVTVPAGVVYLLWSAAYGTSTERESPTLDQVVEFVATGLTAALQALLRLPGAGTLALVALVTVTATAALTRRQRSLAAAGLIGLAVMMLALATSRAVLGAVTAGSGRYNYFALILLAPALALGLDLAGRVLRDRRSRILAGATLTLALAVNGVAQTIAFAESRLGASPGLRDQVVATESFIDEGQAFLVDRISVPYNPDLDITSLRLPWVRDAVPDGSVGSKAKLNASVLSQANAASTSFGLPFPGELSANDLSRSVEPGSCRTVLAGPSAYVDLPSSPTGTQVLLRSSASSYPVQLIGRNDGLSRAVLLTAAPGSPTYVGSTSQRGTLRITLAAGPVEVCLADSP